MIKTKTKKNYTKLLLVLLTAALVTIGILSYFLAKEVSSPRAPEKDRGECKTIESNEICTGDYIGLTETQAKRKTKENSLKSRVIERNGKGIFHTFDLDPFRLNFSVNNGVVTKVEFY